MVALWNIHALLKKSISLHARAFIFLLKRLGIVGEHLLDGVHELPEKQDRLRT